MFECETLQDLIQFKWDNLGFKFHLFALFWHVCYVVILFLYTKMIYADGSTGLADENSDEKN